MAVITQVVSRISDAVVAALAEAGAPPLTAGRILLGRQHVAENIAAPRIIFIPVSGRYDAKSVSSASTSGAANERRIESQHRALRTERVAFEVRVWGVAPGDDRDLDFDYTQDLAQEVIRCVHALSAGRYDLADGKWTDGTATSGELVTYGREYVFGIALETPITGALLPYVPVGTAAQTTTNLDIGDGTPEVAFADP